MALQKNEKSHENFQKELDELLLKLKKEQTKPSLLLHACCGPCSSYVLEYLAQYFSITVYYYNPNIYPKEEYFRRLNELKELYTKFPPVLNNNIQVVEDEYNPEDFFDAIKIKEEPELAEEGEKGIRCQRCYEFRLKKARAFAISHNFDYFCTTLSISPFKDSVKINKIGNQLQQSNENPTIKWLPSDFKKKGGFKRSLELSAEYNLYRQTYCGCIYSYQSSIRN